ncbi:MAG: Rcs stress response system protein RcsF [Rahnella inusitata]|jgi:RcsF protein|uniref:Outer membrane lipoprotein RcsF n=1 Tax=Rahnella inusitata TaxID=58169 RepID=A0ABX9NWD3_9GAMM|nr:Rcs stress response system protein RcsF [Rahnella inusitata]NMC24942.1 Rcs stress response system protein RcsF [Serratia sp. (in: enterobacteria)]QUT16435.1 Rcs stress response system protein RcsF [Rahnella inusitata]RJT09476.1 Rcs stress response system protein RcsF [Rahnella inusitata]
MRALPLCLSALLLAGCSLTQHTQPITTAPVVKEEPKPVKPKPAPVRPAPVKLYKDAEALVGTPFRDLGEVSGESCQSDQNDAPPSLATARKRMLTRASYMKANAVLLHQCQILGGVPGCFQQAICQGSALNVTFK